MWLPRSQAVGEGNSKDERAFGDSATPTVPFLAELVGGEGDSVGSFIPSVYCHLAPIWRPLLSGWMGCFLAGLNHQGFLLLGGRMEVPSVWPAAPAAPEGQRCSSVAKTLIVVIPGE